MVCDTILAAASGIYQDLGEPSGLSPSYIAAWMVYPQNIGKLNNAIATCYSGCLSENSGQCICPELGNNEYAIYSLIYQEGYYTREISKNLGANGVTTRFYLTEVKEGDSSIKFTSKTEIAKVYKDLRNQLAGELNDAIMLYRANAAVPRTVDYCPPR